MSNWFHMPEEVNEEEITEIQITDDVYSTRCTFKELFENEEAAAVLNKYLGDGFKERPTFSMTQGFKIDTLAEMAADHFPKKLLFVLNKELTKIRKG